MSCSSSCEVNQKKCHINEHKKRNKEKSLASSYLPKLPISFDENHGGELQQTHNDGALAEVVLVHLPRAEVGRLLAQREAALGCGQITSCQFTQEESHGCQEA